MNIQIVYFLEIVYIAKNIRNNGFKIQDST